MKIFSIDEVNDLGRKDTKKVIEYMRHEIPNNFVTMATLIQKFKPNARTHVKKLEGTETFRIKRFDEQGSSRKETDFWVLINPNVLTLEQIDKFVALLRVEQDEEGNFRYPYVTFENNSPQVIKEGIEPKKRGRKVGSKNKPKDTPIVESEVDEHHREE